jgi:hypothetical protein
MKEESRNLINSLQDKIKKQTESFENEKNQLYDFIEKVSLDFKELAEQNNIKMNIPSKFFLNIL